MKKNKMMRSASALLVMTLLTTSMISGTFAKYTTSASATDTARVAKWGVTVGTSGKLFDVQYKEDDQTDDSIEYSVISSNNPQDSVVAPGTKNENGITFTITGTPEVAVDVEVKVTGANSAEKATDIFLKQGSYANLTTGTSSATVNGVATTAGDTDYFAFNTDYYPVVYTLKDGTNILATGTLSTIEDYLEKLSGRYAANTNLATALGSNTKKSTTGNYTLTWAWAYPTLDDTETDQKDTLLGNLAADKDIAAKGTGTFVKLEENTEYSLNTAIKVEIKVTQVD